MKEKLVRIKWTGKPAKNSKTDWERLRRMKDGDIDYSDNPPTTKEFWKDAILVPAGKIPMSMWIDDAVMDWFKHQGAGYQSLMNRVLRAYMDQQKQKSRRK